MHIEDQWQTRVEALEARSNRLRCWLLGCGVLLLLLVGWEVKNYAMGQQVLKTEAVTAGRLRLVSPTWGWAPDGPSSSFTASSILLRDQKGVPRLALDADTVDGAKMTLFDQKGIERYSLTSRGGRHPDGLVETFAGTGHASDPPIR